MSDNVQSVTQEVAVEVERAMQIHRGMNSLHEAKAVIEEELDEFWEQVKINPKKLEPEDQKLRIGRLRNELIQTAAMCVRAILDLEVRP